MGERAREEAAEARRATQRAERDLAVAEARVEAAGQERERAIARAESAERAAAEAQRDRAVALNDAAKARELAATEIAQARETADERDRLLGELRWTMPVFSWRRLVRRLRNCGSGRSRRSFARAEAGPG